MPNFDRREALASPAPKWSEAQNVALDRLRKRGDGIAAVLDPIFGTANSFTSQSRPLAEPAIPRAGREREEETLRQFVDANAELFGWDSSVFETVKVQKAHTTPETGLRTIVWQQSANGLPILGAAMKANFNRDGALVAVSGRFVPPEDLKRLPAAAAPKLSKKEAIQKATLAIGEESALEAIVEYGPGQTPEERAVRGAFGAPTLKSASAQLVILPVQPGEVRLCWDTLVESRKFGEMFRVITDAGTGELQMRVCLTAHQAAADLRVFTTDSPTPMSPGHPTPLTAQPPPATRQLRTIRAFDAAASPNGWIADMDNPNVNHFTLGNNARAFLDRDGDGLFGLNDLPTSGLSLTFAERLGIFFSR